APSAPYTSLSSFAYVYNSANQRTNFVNAASTFVAYTYDLIGQVTVASSTTISEDRGYLYDAAWNLNDLTNDAFGNTLSSTGSLATANTYQFSSKEYIPTVGLYYYLYRFYAPALQRWLNRDPLTELGFLVHVILSDTIRPHTFALVVSEE